VIIGRKKLEILFLVILLESTQLRIDSYINLPFTLESNIALNSHTDHSFTDLFPNKNAIS